MAAAKKILGALIGKTRETVEPDAAPEPVGGSPGTEAGLLQTVRVAAFDAA